MEFGILLRLVGAMNLILILSDYSSKSDFVATATKKEPLKLTCFQPLTDQFLSNLVW